MDDMKNVDPMGIIDELLEQNSKLRLELATLTVIHKHQTEIEEQMKQSRQIPPEAMDLISKLDIR